MSRNAFCRAEARRPLQGKQRAAVSMLGVYSLSNTGQCNTSPGLPQINFKQLLNFDGIYVADRFSAKGGPVFRPTPNNTLWLPFEHEMHERDKEPGGKFAWATYKGGLHCTCAHLGV